jgi:hypothetical protein
MKQSSKPRFVNAVTLFIVSTGILYPVFQYGYPESPWWLNFILASCIAGGAAFGALFDSDRGVPINLSKTSAGAEPSESFESAFKAFLIREKLFVGLIRDNIITTKTTKDILFSREVRILERNESEAFRSLRFEIEYGNKTGQANFYLVRQRRSTPFFAWSEPKALNGRFLQEGRWLKIFGYRTASGEQIHRLSVALKAQLAECPHGYSFASCDFNRVLIVDAQTTLTNEQVQEVFREAERSLWNTPESRL